MACNNKDFHKDCELPYCKITNGECQFITHEEICPMRDWNMKNDENNTNQDLSIPLCFEAVDAGATIALKCNGNNLKTATFQTSTDGNAWTDYTYATSITLTNAGDMVYFKAKEDNTAIARTSSNYLQFTTTQEAKKVKVSGNIMSLLAQEFSQMRSVSSCCFYCLFYICKNISDCGSLTLPATTLADGCYGSMFTDCHSLTQAPALPATTLASGCYSNMFSSCKSLTQAPVLPATTLADYCYINMFNKCSSLTQAPALPATTLANNCYSYMFIGCSSLTQAPALPATTLANNCYYGMFGYCTSLTQAPDLPATTLADYCYYQMFCSCISLTQASFQNLERETVTTDIVKGNVAFNEAANNIETTCKDGILVINSTSV